MKKILFVIDSLNCGGAERSLLSLLSVLDSTKYEKHLWVLHPGGVLDKVVPSDVTIEQQPVYNKLHHWLYRLAHAFFSVRWRQNRKKNHKCHHAEVFWQSCGFITKGLDKSFDIAVAYQQGIPTYLVASKIHARVKVAWINTDIKSAGYDIPYNVSFYDKMHYIVCVSDMLEGMVKGYMSQFTDKIRCVYDIVSPEMVRNMASEPVAELEDCPSGRIVLTTVARMAYLKNYPLAVKTAALLRQRGLDFIWFFVGDGSKLGQIRRMIHESHLNDCVLALGLRLNPYPYIKACDIYVQTSLHEGFGLTIAEAKMLCKPIVSTNFEVVYNQLEDGVNGLIAKMTPESLADAICTLANDSGMRTRYSSVLKGSVDNNASTELKKIEEMFQI